MADVVVFAAASVIARKGSWLGQFWSEFGKMSKLFADLILRMAHTEF